MRFTTDKLLNGRIALRQDVDGYRAGMDAALLAAACDVAEGETVFEAGCGVGAVLLSAAVRRPGAQFVGVERDPAALELALSNIALNSLGDRISAHMGDVGGPHGALDLGGHKLGAFDAALANPPFFDDERTLRGPAPAKRGAWIADGGLAVWLDLLTRVVRERGTITLIHRADRLTDLLSMPRAGSFQLRPVHAFTDSTASRVLLRAVKGGRAPLRLLPPLVLHARKGAKHTPEAEAVFRGNAALEWL